jgi:ParB family chromosome partitioning protein
MSTKRQALGRGLAALIPSALPPPEPADSSMTTSPSAGTGELVAIAAPLRPITASREGLRIVGIEEVHPARSQPRKTFDDDKLNELTISIQNQGLIQPLVVRNRDGGGYEIIAGERRWRAAQRAGMHTIPVIVREIAPDRAFELAMVENLQREDLNPIEEAEGFERLIRDFDYTQESLAARIGKDRTSVTNALRLLKLPLGVRALVIGGRLSMGHARAILGLESVAGSATASAELMDRTARRVASREMSVRQVEELVRKEKERATAAESSPGKAAGPSASARDLAARLSRTFATRVRVVESGEGRGHIEIHYGSLDQLDGLLTKLMEPSIE